MMQKDGNHLKWLPVPIVLAVLCLLLVALWAGLARLGVPGVQSSQITVHGPLMVLAVLGTLICLERAVALDGVLQCRWRRLAFVAPLLSAFGGILLAAGWQDNAARVVLLLASLGLVAIFMVIMIRHFSTDVGIMMLGSITLLAGNGLWLMGKPVFEVVHWWIAFLVLTIVGERLELSRVRRMTPRRRGYLTIIIMTYLVSIVLTTVNFGTGIRLEGLSYLLMAWWLFRYDVARVTVRHKHLPQFAAASLLSGYFWLGIGGMIALWQGALYAGLFYEAFLHALLVGFVFSMIFGHAPIIIPAITGRSLRFNRLVYIPLFLLHSSLILRIASNITTWLPGRQWGGTLNAVSILVYLALILFLMVSSESYQSESPSGELGVLRSRK